MKLDVRKGSQSQQVQEERINFLKKELEVVDKRCEDLKNKNTKMV